ncbi:MAG: hypothetical protein NNA22_01605, partial [Nitrospira sp.]|nr:hypothetical protein [Nitrospira sp.]
MHGTGFPNRRTIIGILTDISILTAAVIVCCLTPSASTAADDVSPAALFDIVSGHAAQLASLDSNAAATTLFISTIGPSL